MVVLVVLSGLHHFPRNGTIGSGEIHPSLRDLKAATNKITVLVVLIVDEDKDSVWEEYAKEEG